ncbi:MAG: hypothetical protein Q8R37_00895 [Nanoarchaeota archaeon]|nr:hypothetical protein [Nanoarchaeota archaeon]
MGKGYQCEGEVIVINRELTELDLFVKDFLAVLQKYSDYLIVSGFVSISTGRTRGTEDVDLLVPVMSTEKFKQLFDHLQLGGFWCYQADSAEEAYSYIRNLQNIRFAKVNEMFPNMEVIPINETKKTKFFEFNHPQKMRVHNFEFKIPPLEFEILYKELVLSGVKDIADAKHLRTFFADILKKEKFKEYESIVRLELR